MGTVVFLAALRKKKGKGMRWGWYGLPTKEVTESFGRLAVPLVARCVLGMGVYTLLARSAATAGVMAIAGHQVAMQLFWTLSFFPEPLSIAAQSLIARDLTTNNKVR